MLLRSKHFTGSLMIDLTIVWIAGGDTREIGGAGAAAREQAT